MLAIFLGLFSASIFPTVSLLINAMTSNGRSVHALNKLKGELEGAMDAMFFIFACVGIAIGAVLLRTIEVPTFLRGVPYVCDQILPRLGQAFMIAPTVLVIWRAGQITGILRRLLKLRHAIAIEEARAELAEKAPPAGETAKSFQTNLEFGRVVSLKDLQDNE